MKVFAVFNAHSGGQEVNGEIVKAEAKEQLDISGVNSVEVLERVAGEVPRYCIVLDIDDATAQETGEKLLAALGQSSPYMTNVAWGAYKNV
jgi:hypothetical protein